MIGAGAAAVLDSATSVSFTLAGVLAVGLIIVGVAMIASTWFGRAHGLIPIGIILLLAAIPATAIDVPISGGVGEHQYKPTTRAEIQSHYKLGIGHLALWLQYAPLANHDTTISGQLGIGELEVEVPSNVRVDVNAHAGAGHTELFGRGDGGWPHDDHAVAGVNQSGVLHLDLRVGAGAVIVRRRAPNGELLTNPYVVNG
jgi:predicted membrane protein